MIRYPEREPNAFDRAGDRERTARPGDSAVDAAFCSRVNRRHW
ncbi:hypothetical protein [Halorubrum sp. SS7]|nr:hypothetical protein [Halorubrum sp. SS7]